ncbi:glycosyltransferase family 25 protein [Albimonas pacifica]|uniref:Glycosyltransferase family 25 (LPS biosynthesis protein) n=1 Tax=Albimonas pacifica TaxID=1114924 RepID=A0A1I3P170_9RHOB|nr:glycosyltransferase family 25 protein [Albimonas pacifica]SFJ15199.1 Glycosyltransferase family 25 (LPS biosynthesis protein) [Albimonas pacifica]
MDVSQDFAQIFERIYVVNLDSRPDRLRGVEAQLARVGLRIDGGVVRRLPAVRPAEKGDWPSLGALGCYMSHLTILREARDDGLGAVAIVEDDLDFSRTFLAHPGPYLAALRAPDWRMFHCGAVEEPAGRRPVRALAPGPDEAMRCTHFVAFRAPVIGALVDQLELFATRPNGHPEGGPMHVDGAYHTYRMRHPETPLLTFDPPLGVQRSSASDITPAWHDRLPILRRGLAVARRLRQAL